MRLKHLACLLLASLACGQTTQPPAAGAGAGKVTSAAAEAPVVKVGLDDPVITVNGFCTDPAEQRSGCRTVITRAQFEKLAEALQPGMSLALRLKVANAYARNMRMSAAAEKRGLDKTPGFEEEMGYARMQLLSQDLDRVLRAEANNISDEDLVEYYKKNEPSFEQATVARIFVPQAKQIATASEKQAAEDAMTKVAASLRARDVNGEDPNQLQIEAYAEAGIARDTVETKMEKVRRTTLPPQHESVMDLKPGEVSEVFSDPGGAHFIYKMIRKQTLTLEDAKAEIRSAISRQRYRDSMKGFEGDVVFSDAYFNPSGEGTAAPQRNRKDRKRQVPGEKD